MSLSFSDVFLVINGAVLSLVASDRSIVNPKERGSVKGRGMGQLIVLIVIVHLVVC